MREYLDRLHPEKPPRYTRATMETWPSLPTGNRSRGGYRRHRGVTVNSLIIKQLEDRGWVEVIGHRETVGVRRCLPPPVSFWTIWACSP